MPAVLSIASDQEHADRIKRPTTSKLDLGPYEAGIKQLHATIGQVSDDPHGSKWSSFVPADGERKKERGRYRKAATSLGLFVKLVDDGPKVWLRVYDQNPVKARGPRKPKEDSNGQNPAAGSAGNGRPSRRTAVPV